MAARPRAIADYERKRIQDNRTTGQQDVRLSPFLGCQIAKPWRAPASQFGVNAGSSF